MSIQRILILHDNAGKRGGAEIIAFDLRNGLRNRGIDARLMTTSADPYNGREETPDYICAGTSGAGRALLETYNAAALWRLLRVLEEFRPDAVHVLMFLTALSPAVLGPLWRVPVVLSHMTFREVCPSGTRLLPDGSMCEAKAGLACIRNGCFTRIGLLPRQLQLSLLKRARGAIDRSVAPSKTMAAILKSQGWPVTDVLPFGVPALPRVAEMDVRPTIAFAGRLTKEKGVGWFLSAVAKADHQLREARVEIIGDGPERTSLEALVVRLGIGDRVVFRGHLERKISEVELARAWAQVVPSLWAEPFGLVSAEALMRGTPVIVSDRGASREIVNDGENGWVVPAGNTDALATALVGAIASREQAINMGRLGAQKAQRVYDFERWIDRTLGIYSEICHSHVRRPRQRL